MTDFLKKEIKLIKFGSVPEELLNEDEVKEILQIEKEMESGERINIEDAFKEIF